MNLAEESFTADAALRERHGTLKRYLAAIEKPR